MEHGLKGRPSPIFIEKQPTQLWVPLRISVSQSIASSYGFSETQIFGAASKAPWALWIAIRVMGGFIQGVKTLLDVLEFLCAFMDLHFLLRF